MSKRKMNGKASLIVVATPAPYGAGQFEARLDGDDHILCVSRTPLFDAARKLLADGYDSDLSLVLRHKESKIDCLRVKLGTAATLSVEETKYGPKVRRWKPIPALAVTPRIASDGLAAITIARQSIQRASDER
jgi:hypothetical protein